MFLQARPEQFWYGNMVPVVTSSLEQASWNNTKLIKRNVVEEISKLKADTGRDILVAGSGQLVTTLLQNNLVDEIRLMVYPVILGKGRRLLNEDIAKLPLHLDDAMQAGSGILILVYHYERK